MILDQQQKAKKFAIKIPFQKRPSVVAQEMVKDLRERQHQYEVINKPWQESTYIQPSEQQNHKYKDLVADIKKKYFQDQVDQRKAMKLSQLNELADHSRREKEIMKQLKAEFSKKAIDNESDFNSLPIFIVLTVILVITIISLLIYG